MKAKYIFITIGILAAIAGIIIYLDMTAWGDALNGTTTGNATDENNTDTAPAVEDLPGIIIGLEPTGDVYIPPPVKINTEQPLITTPIKNLGGSPAADQTLDSEFYGQA